MYFRVFYRMQLQYVTFNNSYVRILLMNGKAVSHLQQTYTAVFILIKRQSETEVHIKMLNVYLQKPSR